MALDIIEINAQAQIIMGLFVIIGLLMYIAFIKPDLDEAKRRKHKHGKH